MLIELVLLLLINGYRAEYAVPPLLPSAQLADAAEWMAEDMAERDYFNHTDSLGGTPWTRMCDAGYREDLHRGENLAAGSKGPRETLALWINSSGHNDILLDPIYVDIGISRAYDVDSVYGYYWTADFGGCSRCPESYPQWRW